MATRRNQPPQGPNLTHEEKRRCIDRLRKRIAELEAFDPKSVTKRFDDPNVLALEAAIDQALTVAFGANTTEYNLYSHATRLDYGPVQMSSPDWISARSGGSFYQRDETCEAQGYLAEGKARAIALLKRAVEFLQEELGGEHDEPTISADSSRYSVQRVCMNGHQRAVDIARKGPEPFCSECGEKTITGCQNCAMPLRGSPVLGYALGLEHAEVPNFCFNCGNPLPWTERKFDAAIALLDEAEEASDADRVTLRGALVAISADTPQTDIGVIRIKKLIGRIGKPIGDAIYKIAIDVASEAAKKSLFGG